MVRLREAVRNAASNPDVTAIVLRIDSPGGTVAGTADLGAEIAAAKRRKPVYAFVEDLAASAAYWLASQATKVYANTETALVGSVGTYFAVYDLSRMAENEGIEAVVIRTSPLKGAGFPGEKVTDEQRAVWQELVDGSQKQFTAAVRSGRSMNEAQVAAVAVGRVWQASEALKLKLIDGVKSFDDVLTEARNAGKAARKDSTTMSASYQQLKLACGGIDTAKAEDAMFLASQLEQGATVESAAKAWNQTLVERVNIARSEKGKSLQGTDPVLDRGRKAADDSGYSGDPLADFNERVQEKMEKTGMNRRKAVMSVAKADPELHRAYLVATNPGRKAASLIADRFEL